MHTDLMSFIRLLFILADLLFAGVLVIGIIKGTFQENGTWVIVALTVALLGSAALIFFK